MRLINGLELADAGMYLFDGRVVNAAYLRDSEAAQRFHQRVGFVFQNADAQLFCATVLDEPTNGLDEDSCDIVVNFLLAYVAAGKTVLMSTHHQDLVRRLGARAIYIDRYHHVVEAPVSSYGTESGAAE